MSRFVDPTPNIFRNVRRMRQARGWSAQYLADRLADLGCDFSRQALSNGENGRAELLTVYRLFALARVLNVSIDELADQGCPTCHGHPPAGFSCLDCGTAVRP